MKRFETSVEIQADSRTVWNVLTDIASLPRWTASVTYAQLAPAGPLALGSVARIKQPRLGTATWTVTELTPEVSFTWTSARPGITTTGIHRLASTAGGVTVTLIIEQDGRLAGLVSAVAGETIRRYIGLEATGLKRMSEAQPSERS